MVLSFFFFKYYHCEISKLSLIFSCKKLKFSYGVICPKGQKEILNYLRIKKAEIKSEGRKRRNINYLGLNRKIFLLRGV